ncbi:MAG: prepilin peptidase [Armatimonadota bacterium]|nr:prepilin peptidase [Armatimonadota bacterium]
MLLLALFILGTQVGSFLNVCIWRLPRGESIVHPPSHCPRCNTRLRFADLVPLLSQLLLRARCRYCGAKISWRYFGVEFLTGLLFALVGAQSGNIEGGWWSGVWVGDPVRLLQGLIFVSALTVIFWVDYDTRLIQLEAVFMLGLIGVAGEAWQVWRYGQPLTDGAIFAGWPLLPAPLPQSILAMVVTATVLWLLRETFSRLYQKEALGFGDVLLVAGIAANLGWNATIVTFFFLSVVVGALVGIGLQIPQAIKAYRWARQRQRRYGSPKPLPWPLARHVFRRAIPFGPMLAVGAIVALLYGQRLNTAYLNLWIEPPGSMMQNATSLNPPSPPPLP